MHFYCRQLRTKLKIENTAGRAFEQLALSPAKNAVTTLLATIVTHTNSHLNHQFGSVPSLNQTKLWKFLCQLCLKQNSKIKYEIKEGGRRMEKLNYDRTRNIAYNLFEMFKNKVDETRRKRCAMVNNNIIQTAV